MPRSADRMIVPFARPEPSASDVLAHAESVLAIDAGTVASAASQGLGLLVCLGPGDQCHVVLERELGAPTARRRT